MEVSKWQVRVGARIFRFGEQGQLEYMVHAKAQRAEIRVDWSDLQYAVRHHGREEIDRDTADSGWRFPTKIHRPRVAHFPGQKPHVLNFRHYSRAFTIARLEHHRKSKSELAAWSAVLAEELPIYFKKATRRLRRSVGG